MSYHDGVEGELPPQFSLKWLMLTPAVLGIMLTLLPVPMLLALLFGAGLTLGGLLWIGGLWLADSLAARLVDWVSRWWRR